MGFQGQPVVQSAVLCAVALSGILCSFRITREIGVPHAPTARVYAMLSPGSRIFRNSSEKFVFRVKAFGLVRNPAVKSGPPAAATPPHVGGSNGFMAVVSEALLLAEDCLVQRRNWAVM